MAGLSPSIVMSVTTVGTIITAVAFYFAYQEKLTVQHVISMVLFIAGIVMIGFSNADTKEDHSTENTEA